MCALRNRLGLPHRAGRPPIQCMLGMLYKSVHIYNIDAHRVPPLPPFCPRSPSGVVAERLLDLRVDLWAVLVQVIGHHLPHLQDAHADAQHELRQVG